jgi:5'-nucleotidase
MRFYVPAALLWLASCSHAPYASIAKSPSIISQEKTVRVQLLALNDFHGNLSPSSFAEPGITTGKVQAGGVAYLTTKINELTKLQPNSLVLGVGDMIGASPLVSALLQDEPTVEALNAMGLRYSAVGNHEFDYGLASLLRLQKGGCATGGCIQGRDFLGAKFDYLAANIFDAKTDALIFPASKVAMIDGVRIGFIGADLTDTPAIALAKNVVGLRFADEATSINAEVAKLKAQGVRSIVVMVHLGGIFASKVDPANCEGVTGPIVKLVNTLDPEVDVVLSAHSHRAYVCNLGKTLLTQGASYGHLLTQVQLEIDRASGEIVAKSAQNLLIDSSIITPDPGLLTLVKNAQTLTDQVAMRPAGRILGGSVSVAKDAAKESDLARLVADAQLNLARTPENGAAVIALVNSGGVRTDLPPTARAARADGIEITYSDVYSVHPFGNEVQVLELTGAELKDVLERPFDGSDHLIASSSLHYALRLSAPEGQRVIADSMRLNGKAILATDRLRVAINNYLVGGGSGQTQLIGKPVLAQAGLDRDALVGYLKLGALLEYKKMRVDLVQ